MVELESQDNNNPREHISPDLLWSKYSVIQQLIFWLVGLAAWHGLNWIGANYERFTLPIWRYVSTFRSYFFTGNMQGMILLGTICGLAILGLLVLTDYIIARSKNEKPAKHILRNYYLLPRTNKQRYIALFVGINAGIFEELFFRGALYILFFILTGSVVLGVLFTAILFAILHAPIQGWYSSLWIFMVGIFLNILILQTESYYASIFCHIVINIGNLFLIPAMLEEELEDLILHNSDSNDTSRLQSSTISPF
jgi:membrane protease YdiL (CAAX protease family)